MSFVFDADILSVFAKIKKINLLRKAISEKDFLIPESVYLELVRGRELGYDVDDVLDNKEFKIASMFPGEIELFEKLKENKQLGSGECEAISICKHRNFVFVTNDKIAKRAAEELDILTLGLISILRFCFIEFILTKNEIENLIKDIEEKENTVIKNKELIFS